MKIKKEKIIFVISFLFSVFTGYLIWGLIELEFKDRGIIGEYSKKNHHALNDILRYLAFLLLPSLTFFFYNYYKNQSFLSDIKIFFCSHEEKNFEKSVKLNLFFILLVLLLLASFLSVNFSTALIDSYHEGQRMSSAYKNFLDDSMWSGSYITVGIFYETLSSSIFWKFFDHISIGIARYTDILYTLTFKLLSIFFIYFLTKLTNLDQNKKIIFFLINSLFFVSLSNYDVANVGLISFREIPIILLLILFIFLISKKNSLLPIIFISVLTLLSMFWGIDRGLIYNILTLLIFLYLFLSKRYLHGLLLLLFIIIIWTSFFLISKNEFHHFVQNTYLIYKEMSYVHGIIHPTPFSNEPNSSRATKTILLILICVLISVNIIFKKEYPINFKRIIFFLTLVSVGSYLYALGRSDGPHIKNSFGFPLITVSIFLTYIILKNTNIISKFNYNIISFIFIVFFMVTSDIKPSNIFSIKERLNKYFYLDDEVYLNEDEKVLVNFLNSKVESAECVQLFSNDVALYYLLRKKSCTKFYFVWSVPSVFNQNRFIDELENVNLIIDGGPKNDWDYSLNEKLYLVDEYIKINFKKIESYKSWNILIRD